ncbi:DNA replication complex subunit Gins51 [Halostagnicola kamekurae]|uniref:DNA replication factor GINS n=1 Tax=Halostagnicola kamekurae TaxID=619731 RepID=A0A1I6QCF4_9EURY|nr:hypothetical protein [Halostagnicola kamekurae]SFS50173.1 DNA replication factor GINS [Halostagnicola kamekurae]
MNLDELRSVQSKERQKDSLQNLRPSFYQEVGEYISDLEDRRDRAAAEAEDPFSSPEVSRLTDEIETAKDVVEAIYERRMGKLVKQASLSAAGMAANDEGLTAEEADLFDDLVDRIQSNKTRVLDVLEGVDAPADELDEQGPNATDRPNASDQSTESTAQSDRESSDTAPPAPPETPPADLEPSDSGPANRPTTEDDSATAESSGVSAADVMGGDPPEPATRSDAPDSSADDPMHEDSAADEASEAPATDGGAATASSGEPAVDDATTDDPSLERLTVKITEDVGSILGVDDREYSLAADDVVTLPEQNATPLVEREAAEQLD